MVLRVIEATSGGIPASSRPSQTPFGMRLRRIIDDAYRWGEAGILKTDADFRRVTPDEFDGWWEAENEHLLVLMEDDQTVGSDSLSYDFDPSEIVGCIKVTECDGYCELGCLAVETSRKEQGCGRRLMEAAEAWAFRGGHRECRLDLLAPVDGSSQHKERLRRWYTSGLGYRSMGKRSFRKGEALAPDRFRLVRDADFTKYAKRIGPRATF